MTDSTIKQCDKSTQRGFSALMNAAVDAIIIIDKSGQILDFNKAAEKLFGYQAIEVQNKNVSMLMPSPYKHEHDQYISHYLATRNPKIIGIGRRVEALKKEGSIFPIELTVGEYAERNETYFVGIIHDLTEKERTDIALKVAEDQLKTREQTLLVTIDNAPIGIMTIDLNGMILSANMAVLEMLDYAAEDVTNKKFTNFIHRNDLQDAENRLQDLTNGHNSSFVSNTRYLRKSGEIAHAVLHCSIVKTGPDSQPDRLIVQLVDRSNEVHAEQEAADIRERLAHVDRVSTMGEMASGIAHEINQPLTAISSYVQACQRRLDSTDIDVVKLRELLDKTANQAQRAGAIVKNIRSLIKRHDQFRDRVEINKILDETIHLSIADARSRGLEVDLDLMPQSRSVIADSIQIQQVILNLIRNAIDATEEAGNGNHHIQIGIKDAEQTDYVQFWVKDSGNGIPDDIKNNLFEPFITSKKMGIGMGLSISRSIINAHGGTIWAENSDDGTLFCFSLPIAVG